jgi:glucokinase
VVVNGEIVTGPSGRPPEIGAICLEPEGPVNYSGIPGTFEHLASASGLLNLYASRGGRRDGITPRDVFAFAARGEKAASAAVDRFGGYIAQALGIMINILNPEACLLGGGISAAGEPLLDAVRRHLPCFTWPNLYRNTRVILAGLGNDAGWIGAAAIAARRGGLNFDWTRSRPEPPLNL